MNDYTYCFFVEYIEDGVECFDTWSEYALNLELQRKEVEITSISLAYSVQKALGIAED